MFGSQNDKQARRWRRAGAVAGLAAILMIGGASAASADSSSATDSTSTSTSTKGGWYGTSSVRWQ